MHHDTKNGRERKKAHARDGQGHYRHDHDHGHHDHGHHDHGHDHGRRGHSHAPRGSVLVLRPGTGIAGDMMVAGLARMLEADQSRIDAHIASIGLPELVNGLRVEAHALNEVSGWTSRVSLPHEHAHRTPADILAIIESSAMSATAKDLAASAFTILAEAEADVHGKNASEVGFHEVGALDSVLDTCLAAALFAELAPDRFVCGPLPLCDGAIRCAHGLLPAPAPAVMKLLRGVPVHGIASEGETVTPTGLALLKAFGAEFGPWPSMLLEKEALVYGAKVFPNVPNGVIFAYGKMTRG